MIVVTDYELDRKADPQVYRIHYGEVHEEEHKYTEPRDCPTCKGNGFVPDPEAEPQDVTAVTPDGAPMDLPTLDPVKDCPECEGRQQILVEVVDKVTVLDWEEEVVFAADDERWAGMKDADISAAHRGLIREMLDARQVNPATTRSTTKLPGVGEEI
jgi:hypothetical protein